MRKIVCALFWVLLWQGASAAVNLPLLLPAPTAVVLRLAQLCVRSDFWGLVGGTFLRILMGFILGVLLGTLLAIAAYRLPFLEDLFQPAMGVIKATPVASFIILALVWLPSQALSVMISFLMVLPILFHNVLAGLAAADKDLLEMAEVYRLSAWKKIRSIYLPQLLPFFLSAVTSGMGFAWKSGIAAEVLGHPARAIGTQIYQAKIYLETTDLFAWTLVVIVLSVLIEHVFVRLVKKAEGFLLRGQSCFSSATRKRKLAAPETAMQKERIPEEEISLKQVSLSFDGKTKVLSDFSLTLPSSGVVCLFAPSGKGKTSLLRLLCGRCKAQSGEIRGLAKRRVLLMFQEDRLIEQLSAEENIKLVLEPCDYSLAGEYLKELGLAGWEAALPQALSGGMKRRVSLARAFAYGAAAGSNSVYLLDEPLKGLDEVAAENAVAWMKKHRDGGLILFVTHNRKEAQGFADEMISLDS